MDSFASKKKAVLLVAGGLGSWLFYANHINSKLLCSIDDQYIGLSAEQFTKVMPTFGAWKCALTGNLGICHHNKISATLIDTTNPDQPAKFFSISGPIEATPTQPSGFDEAQRFFIVATAARFGDRGLTANQFFSPFGLPATDVILVHDRRCPIQRVVSTDRVVFMWQGTRQDLKHR